MDMRRSHAIDHDSHAYECRAWSIFERRPFASDGCGDIRSMMDRFADIADIDPATSVTTSEPMRSQAIIEVDGFMVVD